MKGWRQAAPPLDFRFLDLLVLLLVALGGLVIAGVATGLGTPERLRIQTENLPLALLGRPYTSQIYALGGRQPHSWLAIELPQGLTFSNSGVLQGRPQRTGQQQVRVKVRSQDGQESTKSFALSAERLAEALPLRILTRTLSSGEVGSPYIGNLAAEGGAGGYQWELTDNVLGLRVDAEGLIGGSPLEAKQGDIGVRVTDRNGEFAVGRVGLTIRKREIATTQQIVEPLKLTTIFPPAIAGEPYSVQLCASGGKPPYRWRFLGIVPGVAVTEDGVFSASPDAVPIALRGGSAYTIVDDSGTSTTGMIQARVIRIPIDKILRIAAVTGAVLAWALLILILKRWVMAYPMPLLMRWADLGTMLSIGFGATAAAAYVGGSVATVVLVIALSILSGFLYLINRN